MNCRGPPVESELGFERVTPPLEICASRHGAHVKAVLPSAEILERGDRAELYPQPRRRLRDCQIRLVERPRRHRARAGAVTHRNAKPARDRGNERDSTNRAPNRSATMLYPEKDC